MIYLVSKLMRGVTSNFDVNFFKTVTRFSKK